PFFYILQILLEISRKRRQAPRRDGSSGFFAAATSDTETDHADSEQGNGARLGYGAVGDLIQRVIGLVVARATGFAADPQLCAESKAATKRSSERVFNFPHGALAIGA